MQKETPRPTAIQPVWSHAAQGTAVLILDDVRRAQEKGGSIDLIVRHSHQSYTKRYLVASDPRQAKTSRNKGMTGLRNCE